MATHSEPTKYWTSLDEETLDGPYNTREEAISEGHNRYGGDIAFHLCRGRRFLYRPPRSLDIHNLMEDFDDANEEYCPEGGASQHWAPSTVTQLQRMMEQTFMDWLRHYNYHEAWAVDISHTEEIEPAIPWTTQPTHTKD